MKKSNNKILIIEDDEISLLLVESILDEKGISYLSTKFGKQAIEMCKSNPDIKMVFIDIKLPDIDGYEVTKSIRKIRPKLPLIALTACALQHEKNRSIASGCNDHISKPIDFKYLDKTIKKYFNQN